MTMEINTVRSDVTVIGGGFHGLVYALWLKKFRPETDITILERNLEPAYKIGESTLAASERTMRAMGLSFPMLRRLFHTKEGLRFWWTDTDKSDLRSHIDNHTSEETFQIERRTIELAFQEIVKKSGIKLILGATVRMSESDIEGTKKKIIYKDNYGKRRVVESRFVCDATGPASLIPRHLNLYKKDMKQHQTFNCNAYWAYFRQKKEIPVEFWEHPLTRHICFPEGWLWFINIISWEKNHHEDMRTMLRYMLENQSEEEGSTTSRDDYSIQFGLNNELMVSIGVVVRDDEDDPEGLSAEEGFWRYVNKYPAVKEVMSHYELIKEPYGPKTTYRSFKQFAHDTKKAAGDGWCAIGDAAHFTNPLWSPGLNFGSGTAFVAAENTAEALQKGNVSEEMLEKYQTYATQAFKQLIAENDMWYRGFKQEITYEKTQKLKFLYAIGSAGLLSSKSSDVYSERMPYLYDFLEPNYVRTVEKIRTSLRHAEEGKIDIQTAAQETSDAVEHLIIERLQLPRVQNLKISTIFNNYLDDGTRVEHWSEKQEAEPIVSSLPCRECGEYYNKDIPECPACGTLTVDNKKTRNHTF